MSIFGSKLFFFFFILVQNSVSNLGFLIGRHKKNTTFIFTQLRKLNHSCVATHKNKSSHKSYLSLSHTHIHIYQ